MQQLSANGQQVIDDIARRHGFSTDAVLSMLESVINGNGSMAQFNHSEFSGSGQWMSGGMTMVSDMFNNYLKGRVDSLCSELSRLVANQPDLLRSGSFQSQSQGGNEYAQQQNNYSGWQTTNDGNGVNVNTAASLFVPPAPGQSADWWPSDLRWPNSTGSQNGVRYAYFAQARRLVIEVNGSVTVYDTLDNQIGSFAQQQSYGGSISFTSQYGLIDVTRLPVLSVNGVAQFTNTTNTSTTYSDNSANTWQPAQTATPSPAATVAGSDVFALIERLAELRNKALITEEDFSKKKAELLSRL